MCIKEYQRKTRDNTVRTRETYQCVVDYCHCDDNATCLESNNYLGVRVCDP